jgi:nucleotide-binding universal stress UspA family protein
MTFASMAMFVEMVCRDRDRSRRARAPSANRAAAARESSHFAVPECRQYLMRTAREQLEALVARQPHLERALTVEVAAGRAHRQIAHVASEMRADLIVLCAHGRGGAPLAALGSTTDQVVRAAPCPALTVIRQTDMCSDQDECHVPNL